MKDSRSTEFKGSGAIEISVQFQKYSNCTNQRLGRNTSHSSKVLRKILSSGHLGFRLGLGPARFDLEIYTFHYVTLYLA